MPSPAVQSPIGDGTAESISMVEPIGVVWARLSADLDALSLAGCAQWLADAQRLTGWLSVARLRVEQIQWDRTVASWAAPEPDAIDRDDENSAAPDPTGTTSATTGVAPHGSATGSPVTGGPVAAEGCADLGAGEALLCDAPGRTSRRQQARDRKLGQAIDLLPSFGRTLELGELTEDHVLALNAIRNRNIAREREDEILAAALARTAEDFAVWLCAWDALVDLDRHGDLTARQKAARRLQLFDRSGEFRGALAPADFDAFKRTLQDIDAELQRHRDHTERLSWDQRMADALMEMTHRARGAGASSGTSSGSGEGSLRTAVVVLIDLADLLAGTGHGTTADGSPVDVGEVRRMAATGHVIPVVLGADSVVLDMGRARRYADDAQWLALLARDGGCVLCDAPLGTLDAHHHPHWQNGGRTDLCSMCLCCTRCHRRVHAEKITIAFTGGCIRAHKPDGTPVPTRNRLDRRPPTARAGAPPGHPHAADKAAGVLR